MSPVGSTRRSRLGTAGRANPRQTREIILSEELGVGTLRQRGGDTM